MVATALAADFAQKASGPSDLTRLALADSFGCAAASGIVDITIKPPAHAVFEAYRISNDLEPGPLKGRIPTGRVGRGRERLPVRAAHAGDQSQGSGCLDN